MPVWRPVNITVASEHRQQFGSHDQHVTGFSKRLKTREGLPSAKAGRVPGQLNPDALVVYVDYRRP